MKSFALLSALTGALLQPAIAVPSQTQNGADITERGLVGDLLGVVGSTISGLNNLGSTATGTAGYGSALSLLESVTPTATPTSPQQALSALSTIYQASPTSNNLYAAIGEVVAAGLTTNDVNSALSPVEGALSGQNSEVNNNTKNPSPSVYPKANPSDAPYDLTEAQLRQVIYIPPTFQCGKTGAPYIPLLTGSTIGDPVWLNIPGYLLSNGQTDAEYVAYAINYIYGISNKRQVAVFGWSQGNIDTQWAFKYWLSTPSKVTDHVAFSPDYYGTEIANFIALGEPLPASSNGGDLAYVPATTVYSGFFDEIVEPQQGTGASAYLNDARNIGVTNNEVQTVCAGQAAGSFYTHEGTLYNALGFALAVDALSHSGPGQVSRLNLGSVCANYLTPDLDLADFLLTETSILIAGLVILVYPNKVVVEPPIESTSALTVSIRVATADSAKGYATS